MIHLTFEPTKHNGATEVAVSFEVCDSYVVVSRWKHPGGQESYSYEPSSTLNEALDEYAAYERGEYSRATAVGIFAAKNGMPIGSRIEPHRLAQLLRETEVRT